jgi:hypothetical protein
MRHTLSELAISLLLLLFLCVIAAAAARGDGLVLSGIYHVGKQSARLVEFPIKCHTVYEVEFAVVANDKPDGTAGYMAGSLIMRQEAQPTPRVGFADYQAHPKDAGSFRFTSHLSPGMSAPTASLILWNFGATGGNVMVYVRDLGPARLPLVPMRVAR